FLEGNFTIKGNDKVGGLFVVGGGGDVVYDATLAGTVGVDGCIYTRGNFTIKGGGGAGINIDSIWVGRTTTLGGSSVVTYNQAYMDALIGLGINADVQITSWQEEYNLH
ncbi:MAG: hypothetical protein NTY47_08855, partial [Candidatus Omnitrophica bacterium]|nr:hypothetical protein [Candidatus Omnitrophota bacterium]